MEPRPREPQPPATIGGLLPGQAYAVPARYHVRLHVEGRGGRLGCVSPRAGGGTSRAGGRPGRFRLSPFGRVARHYWFQVPQKFLTIRLLASDLGPTGIEGLLEVLRPPSHEPGGPSLPDPAVLREAVRWFKAVTTAAYARGMQTKGWAELKGPVWERGYERLLLRTPQALADAIDRLAPHPP